MANIWTSLVQNVWMLSESNQMSLKTTVWQMEWNFKVQNDFEFIIKSFFSKLRAYQWIMPEKKSGHISGSLNSLRYTETEINAEDDGEAEWRTKHKISFVKHSLFKPWKTKVWERFCDYSLWIHWGAKLQKWGRNLPQMPSTAVTASKMQNATFQKIYSGICLCSQMLAWS